jgi:hypothetical protein
MITKPASQKILKETLQREEEDKHNQRTKERINSTRTV